MAEEKKEKKIVSASTGKVSTVEESTSRRTAAAKSAAEKNEAAEAAGKKPPKQRATGLRLLAALMWVLAIGAEVVAILILNKTIYTGDNLLTWLIVSLVVDLIFVVIGSQLWKKSNRIDPASEKDKIKFWLWNNMGVIVSVIAFLPIIILMIRDKDLDPKTKRIAVIAGIVALVVAVASSYTWNPVSQESLEEANSQVEALGFDTVYWTRFGKKYHLDVDCSSLSRSEVLFEGTVNEAFEASRIDLCKICAKAHNVEDLANGIEEVVDEVEPELQPAA